MPEATAITDSMKEDADPDLPYLTTFVGELLVEAASAEEARERATAWAERNLAENAVVPEEEPIRFLPGSDPAADRFLVPIAGTMNLLGPSQEAVDEKTARQIELARHSGPYRHVTMGHFRIRSGAPHAADG